MIREDASVRVDRFDSTREFLHVGLGAAVLAAVARGADARVETALLVSIERYNPELGVHGESARPLRPRFVAIRIDHRREAHVVGVRPAQVVLRRRRGRSTWPSCRTAARSRWT